MEPETIRCVKIWSGWLRLAHWLIAGGVLFALASGWAIGHDAIDPAFWYDWHIMIGQLAALAVLLRIGLLFVPGSGHWRVLLPKLTERQAMLDMLKFYLSLARTPLPAWYAHNPVWKPFYLLNLLVLLAAVATGQYHAAPWRFAGHSPGTLHAWLGTCIALFTVAHLIAVFLHDLKGRGALVSAMIGGSRYFHITRQGTDDTAVFGRRIPVEVKLDVPGTREDRLDG
jgi:Ni/Fe-hydrogenase 1 B-type cytochrome subunit